MTAMLKNRHEVRLCRWSTDYYEIWQADTKWHADDDTHVKIETGNMAAISFPKPEVVLSEL